MEVFQRGTYDQRNREPASLYDLLNRVPVRRVFRSLIFRTIEREINAKKVEEEEKKGREKKRRRDRP
jgi:hypothetical protein